MPLFTCLLRHFFSSTRVGVALYFYCFCLIPIRVGVSCLFTSIPSPGMYIESVFADSILMADFVEGDVLIVGLEELTLLLNFPGCRNECYSLDEANHAIIPLQYMIKTVSTAACSATKATGLCFVRFAVFNPSALLTFFCQLSWFWGYVFHIVHLPPPPHSNSNRDSEPTAPLLHGAPLIAASKQPGSLLRLEMTTE